MQCGKRPPFLPRAPGDAGGFGLPNIHVSPQLAKPVVREALACGTGDRHVEGVPEMPAFRPPCDIRRHETLHCTADDPLVPPGAIPQAQWHPRVKLDDIPVEERMARFHAVKCGDPSVSLDGSGD